MKIDFPEVPPGVHPPTAALAKILKFNGVKNPVTDQPYSEALLLGIGGGIDAGYVLYQFPHLPQPLLRLGFRNQWNNTRAFLEELIDRLSLSVVFSEFDDREEAQMGLQKTIDREEPTLVWVDKAHLPHHHIPVHLEGLINYQVVVVAHDRHKGSVYIDDLSSKPFELQEQDFTSARENLNQNNYLILTFEKAEKLSDNELRDAIIEGIRSCAVRLNNPMKAFGTSNLETWAEKLTDRNDRQGWPRVFKDQRGLYNALQNIYESIKLNGTEGFGLRKLYADFLHESALILNNPTLNTITGQYLQLSTHWSNLAENALPSKIPEFDRVKDLLNKKYLAYRNHDMEIYEKTFSDLLKEEDNIISDFPLDDNGIDQLFERLSSQVQLIAELEVNAAHRLRDITQRK